MVDLGGILARLEEGESLALGVDVDMGVVLLLGWDNGGVRSMVMSMPMPMPEISRAAGLNVGLVFLFGRLQCLDRLAHAAILGHESGNVIFQFVNFFHEPSFGRVLGCHLDLILVHLLGQVRNGSFALLALCLEE
eukprot:scaffold1052_cov50-Attheya_sp.AAC.3